MSFSAEMVNGPQFAVTMKAKAMRLHKDLESISKKTATGIKADAMRNTPTRHGNLRKSWEGPLPIGTWAWEVRNDAEYAIYVENGFTLTKEGLAAMAAKDGTEGWPKQGKGVPRFIQGRHMLASAVHKAEPAMRAAVRIAIAKVAH